MKIPYGISDFGQIRDEGFFYADKTPFLPVLEASARHIVFLRPRRFGKSTLVSMLEHYYDLGRKEHFDRLFQGLWVHEHPTPERSAYLVLTLDFSRVATDAGPEALRRTFVEAVRSRVGMFLLRYRDRIPMLGDLYPRLDDFQDAEALIGRVMDIVAATPHKVYLLIDEYDHFANRLLAGGAGDAYEAIVMKTGFVRTFYRVIRELQWEHLALMLKEQAEVDVNLDALKAALGAMGVEGDIEPFLGLFHAQVLRRLGIRDTRRLLELKYLKAGAKPSQIEAAFAEAEAQVGRYAADEALLPLLLGERELKAGMLVFVGTKRPLFRPWPPAPRAGGGRAKKGAAR